MNIYNNHASKNAAVLYANVAAANAAIAKFDADEYNTYVARENVDGRAVIVVIDEDGFELGVI